MVASFVNRSGDRASLRARSDKPRERVNHPGTGMRPPVIVAEKVQKSFEKVA
jgi:hypothetical protein